MPWDALSEANPAGTPNSAVALKLPHTLSISARDARGVLEVFVVRYPMKVPYLYISGGSEANEFENGQ